MALVGILNMLLLFYQTISLCFQVLGWPDPNIWECCSSSEKLAKLLVFGLCILYAFFNYRDIPACLDQAIQAIDPNTSMIQTREP